GINSIDPNRNDGKDHLNAQLNKQLFEQSGSNDYEEWLSTHQPFNWLAEFPNIIEKKKGFDIIIGNPPYVEYGNELRSRYTLKNYQTLDCGNLHAFTTERCLSLLHQHGRLGLIVPLPAISTTRMASLQSLIKPGNQKIPGRSAWIASFDERPAGLFNGVDQRLIIKLLSGLTNSPQLYTTGINRWTSSSRNKLFSLIRYTRQTEKERSYTNSILKLKHITAEKCILEKFYSNDPISLFRSRKQTEFAIYYRTAGGRYWKVVLNHPMGTGTVSEKVAFLEGLNPYQAVALISSSTFWWYYSTHFDMYNLKDYMIFGFRFSNASESILSALNILGKQYLTSLEDNAVLQDISTKTKGIITQKIYVVNKSKDIIDDIDRVLGRHYGFSENELDFIINYDIKFRMP
ncbi:MAG TPA: hypothetical protein VGD17_07600, partial [Chitinophagaceae bacterium]